MFGGESCEELQMVRGAAVQMLEELSLETGGPRG